MQRVCTVDRKSWLSLMAKSSSQDIKAFWQGAGLDCAAETIRMPEIGSVMVKGRQGGNGAAFHLGEMSVTRCSIKTNAGIIGHGYHQGRSKETAELVAKIDALAQGDQFQTVNDKIFIPLSNIEVEKMQNLAEKAAATKVDFFTMVRGEDE